MRQFPLVAIAAVLGLSLSGCPGQNETSTTTETAPAESPVAEAPATPADPGTESTAAQSATPPSPPESSVATLPRNLDLIPSTNPDQRIQSVTRERPDPFSVVPTTPSVQIEILDNGSDSPGSPAAPSAAAGAGQRPGGTSAGRAGGGQSAGQSGGQSSGARSTASNGNRTPAPNRVPSATAAARVAPPPPPQPTLARAVEVLGVVQVGSVPYAIVSAPNEPTSRYVREGQRLSNGQIAVRRINMNGPTPAVVFEQYGIEVITAVGEGGAPETTEEAPAAVLPAASASRAG